MKRMGTFECMFPQKGGRTASSCARAAFQRINAQTKRNVQKTSNFLIISPVGRESSEERFASGVIFLTSMSVDCAGKLLKNFDEHVFVYLTVALLRRLCFR